MAGRRAERSPPAGHGAVAQGPEQARFWSGPFVREKERGAPRCLVRWCASAFTRLLIGFNPGAGGGWWAGIRAGACGGPGPGGRWASDGAAADGDAERVSTREQGLQRVAANLAWAFWSRDPWPRRRDVTVSAAAAPCVF